MSSFVDNIRLRLAIIAQMIPHTTGATRRALQKERSDLEEKLRKVSA